MASGRSYGKSVVGVYVYGVALGVAGIFLGRADGLAKLVLGAFLLGVALTFLFGGLYTVVFTFVLGDEGRFKQYLAALETKLGPAMFEVLREAACDQATARQIGERRGKTYKRAEAHGGVLMRDAIAKAIACNPLEELH